MCETLSRSARQLLPPLSAREGPFIPICASAIQSSFRSVRQLLSLSRRCIPIRASATLSPLPRVRCPYAPFSHVTALARVLSYCSPCHTSTDPCVSYTLPHVIQVARQLIPSLSRIRCPCLLPSGPCRASATFPLPRVRPSCPDPRDYPRSARQLHTQVKFCVSLLCRAPSSRSARQLTPLSTATRYQG